MSLDMCTSARRGIASLFVLAIFLLLTGGAWAQEPATLFVPVVVSTLGQSGAFFTSEMVETNTGSLDTLVSYAYTDSTGVGSGNVTDPFPLRARTQRVIADAVVYLRSLGLTIPTGTNVVGTLRVTFASLSHVGDAAVTVRTTTPVPVGNPTGRAGLAYSALAPAGLLNGTAFLGGLRQSAQDRTNVAVQNAGAPSDGAVTLHLTWIPSGGPPGNALDVTLGPGGFHQFKLIEFAANASEGVVRIDRTAGTALYYAYAVINDAVTSDGSFLSPIVQGTGSAVAGVTLPTVVETPTFQTEVVVDNLSGSPAGGTLTYVSSFGTATLPLTLGPWEQRTYGDFVQALRDAGAPGVPSPGATVTGALSLVRASGDASAFFLGGRTLNAGGGGRYGVFTAGQPFGSGFLLRTWLYGLRQDLENRTNVAIVNPGDQDATASIQVRIDLFDGATGLLVATVPASETTVAPGAFHQINSILSTYAPGVTQGYARVTNPPAALGSSSNPPILYAVVDDGAKPGQRSGDGAVIPMSPYETLLFGGQWMNDTFGSSGPAADTTLLERISFQMQTTLTLGGNVFGASALGPQTFLGVLDLVHDVGTISGTSPDLGTLSASIQNGMISGSLTNIPSPNVSGLTFSGQGGGLGNGVDLTYSISLIPPGSASGHLTMNVVPLP